MPRPPSPWRRKGAGGDWHAWVKGQCVFLAPAEATKTEAREALNRIVGDAAREARKPRGGLTVRDVINLFLAHCAGAVGRKELEPVTLDGYERFLIPARDVLGRHVVPSLKPSHVTAWLDSRKGWGATSRYNAVTALKRAFNWARDEGHVAENPLARMKRPTPDRREAVMSPAQVRSVVDAMPPGDPFRLLFEAIRETGCRPGEACRLTVDQVDLAAGVWVVRNKTRRHGESTRNVYMNDRAAEITRGLVGRRKSGPVFANTKGRAWTRNAVALRMGRLAARLGLGPEAVAYSLRHEFVTTALERGVPPATVAELVGHKSLNMIMKVYAKLSHRTDHLRDAARRAREGGGQGG